MRFIFSLVLSLVLTSISQAQNKVGNGGKGVFCASENSHSPQQSQLLDFYEAPVTFPSDALKGKTAHEIAESQLKKFASVAPKLSNQYLRRLNELSKEIEYQNKSKLTEIEDSYHFTEPLSENCKVVQLAIRRWTELPGEKPFLIREDLMKQLPLIHQAGLLTHEIVYEHFAKLGETNSIKARQINRYLYQTKMDRAEFWRMIKSMRLPIYP